MEKLALILIVSLVLAFAGNATAKPYNVSNGEWKFSFDLDTPIEIGLNTEAYRSNDPVGGLKITNQVILLNASTQTKLAVIQLYSYEKPWPMTSYPYMRSVLEKMMEANNFTNISTEIYKIDGTDGLIGSGYNTSLGSREYWSFSLIWPSSDSTSMRATAIMSWLGSDLSTQLFDTIHFEQANGWKKPLDVFSNADKEISNNATQLGGDKVSMNQLSGVSGTRSPTQLSTKK